MKTAVESEELYFDELIHDHLLSEETDELHDQALVVDKVISLSKYTQNTTTWD